MISRYREPDILRGAKDGHRRSQLSGELLSKKYFFILIAKKYPPKTSRSNPVSDPRRGTELAEHSIPKPTSATCDANFQGFGRGGREQS